MSSKANSSFKKIFSIIHFYFRCVIVDKKDNSALLEALERSKVLEKSAILNLTFGPKWGDEESDRAAVESRAKILKWLDAGVRKSGKSVAIVPYWVNDGKAVSFMALEYFPGDCTVTAWMPCFLETAIRVLEKSKLPMAGLLEKPDPREADFHFDIDPACHVKGVLTGRCYMVNTSGSPWLKGTRPLFPT